VLPAGRPYPGYTSWQVTAAQDGPWSANASFGPDYAGAGGRPLGLSGYTQTVSTLGARLSVSADRAEHRFGAFTVCALREPGAGTLRLTIGAREETWQLASPERRAECRRLEASGPEAAASVTNADGRPVSITSLAVLTRGPGVVVSNLGVSGSQLIHLSRLNERVVGAELGAYRPDLLILAFGTNEGFSSGFDPRRYEADLRAGIARLRRLAGGNVPILLLGPPDAAARGANGEACGNGVSVPAALGRVREIQRNVARDLGLAYWDWHAAMGGTCASVRWAAGGLMRRDLVHFTRAGGEAIGRALAADLTDAAAARQALRL
jgi:lysophospholipase L1-like esterase